MLFAIFLLVDVSTLLLTEKITIGINYFTLIMYAVLFIFIHKDNLSHNLLKEVD